MKPTPLVVAVLALSLLTPAVHAEVPLPPALLTAKTVVVVNGGVSAKTHEHVVEDIQKWGRWTVIGDPKEAELIITLREKPPAAMSLFGTVVPVIDESYEITDGKTGSPLYADVGKLGRIIGRLKKRIEKAAAPVH